MDVIKDPTHPEYDDVRYWMPDGFDPNHFPIKTIRKDLREFNRWHQQHPEPNLRHGIRYDMIENLDTPFYELKSTTICQPVLALQLKVEQHRRPQ